MYPQSGFTIWHIQGEKKKLTKLNAGSLKSIYLIMWSKINFPLHLDKIKFKCLFLFSMFRILKKRLKRTNIYIDFFSGTWSNLMWGSGYHMPLLYHLVKQRWKEDLRFFHIKHEWILILHKLFEITNRVKEWVFFSYFISLMY